MHEFLNTSLERIDRLLGEANTIWLSGGWAMIALAVVAMVQFAMAIHIYLNLRRMGLNRVPEETWRSWIDEPEQRRGPIGELIDSVTSGRPLEAVREEDLGFEALQARERLPFERDLKVLKVSIGAGPLVGLLGTVTGMLSTFGALGSGSGGEKTMALVARGISEALITTG
jgi:biopolymer transport protein ExbB